MEGKASSKSSCAKVGSVYVADRPRMGRSARTTVGTTITPTAGDQGSFIQFRLGIWPNLYPNSKFPPGPYALDQFRRWGVQAVGPGDAALTLNDLLAIVDRVGPSVAVHAFGQLPFGIPGGHAEPKREGHCRS